MEEMDIKHQFHLLQQEVEAAVSLTQEAKLNFLAAIDSLKIAARDAPLVKRVTNR